VSNFVDASVISLSSSGAGVSVSGAIVGAPTFTSALKITAAGMRESHPHDITITKEAPNYSR
jgi:IMP dehydrogenase